LTQAHLFGAAGRTDSAEVLAELEVDYTPVAVAVQLLLLLEQYSSSDGPLRILDPSAGSGCWGRAARVVFGARAHLVAVEPRASERANLGEVYDEVHICDFAAFAGGNAEAFDIVATNPPFSAFADFWPDLVLGEELLRPGGCLALYGRSQWGQSAEASPALRRWSPSFQWRLCGRPAHRADGKTDSCEYSLWGWDIEDLHLTAKRRRPTWQCSQLLELPAAMRRWSPAAVPGTYPVDPALVAEIRARYL
jgi:hypothetical protein